METVYLPSDDSFLMLEALEGLLKTAGSRPKTVLDMGTGSGILAIAAAKAGCSVTAVDINPDAIAAARRNADVEGAEIDFAVSDLFQNVHGKRFDLMLFNPPYVRTEESEVVDMQSVAWAGGMDGMQVITRFLNQANDFLNPGGKILLMVSLIDDSVPKLQGFKTKVLKKKRLFFESLFVLELEPS